MTTFQANTLFKGLLKYLYISLSLGERRLVYVWVGINIQALEFLSSLKLLYNFFYKEFHENNL